MRKKEKMNSFIALLTDFGHQDPYVGLMKSRIWQECPEAYLLDLTHEIKPFHIEQGIFTLLSSQVVLPEQSVVLMVIDPGVGTKRRGLICKYHDMLIIGPDNGLFSPFIHEGEFYQINEDLFEGVSPTFHGRDIFAPVAGMLACGRKEILDLGKPINSETIITIEYQAKKKGNESSGFLFSEDRFGNWISNFPNDWFDSMKEIQLLSKTGILAVVNNKIKTFSDLKPGEIGFLEGSHGFIEIVANRTPVRECLEEDIKAFQLDIKGVFYE